MQSTSPRVGQRAGRPLRESFGNLILDFPEGGPTASVPQLGASDMDGSGQKRVLGTSCLLTSQREVFSCYPFGQERVVVMKLCSVYEGAKSFLAAECGSRWLEIADTLSRGRREEVQNYVARRAGKTRSERRSKSRKDFRNLANAEKVGENLEEWSVTSSLLFN